MKKFLAVACILAGLLALAWPLGAQVRPLQDTFITCELDDLSTASTTYCAVPTDGKVIKLITVLHTAITTGNAAVTAGLSGTAITGCSITVAFSGSAAGDIDSCTPTGANDAQEDNYLSITTDGGSTVASRLTITAVIRR